MPKKDRRAVLIDRLDQLSQRLDDPDLPVTVDSVGIFGSFCRGKERPKDVDLVIVLHRDLDPLETDESGCGHFKRTADPKWQEWLDFERKMLPKVWRARWKVDDDERPESWAKAAKVKKKYVRWCSVLSRTHFDELSWRGGINPMMVTTRLLRKGLPGINILENTYFSWEDMEEGLTTSKVFLFWSREKPDWMANLDALQNTDYLRPLLASEYANFQSQYDYNEKRIQEVVAQVSAIMAHPRRLQMVPKGGEFWGLLEVFSKQFVSANTEEDTWSPHEGRREAEDRRKAIEAAGEFNEWNEQELAARVESLRVSIKKQPDRMRVWKTLRDGLLRFKSGLSLEGDRYLNKEFMPQTPEKVVEWVEEQIPKRLSRTLDHVLENEFTWG